MKPETQDKLESISIAGLERIASWLERAESFAIDQAPRVVQEIVNWGLWSYSVLTVLSLGFLALFMWLGIRMVKIVISIHRDKDKDDSEGNMWGTFGGISFLVALIWLIPAIVNASGLLYVLVAPRLYVIEQLKDMIK